MNKIVRVDMSTLNISTEEAGSSYKVLGGRALTSRIISEEISPTCHPLSWRNKLVFAPGLLAGTIIPTASRMSIGGKSPLTQTIKESNVGGTFGQILAEMGIKAIVIEKKPVKVGLYLLEITPQGFFLRDCSKYKNMTNYSLTEDLQKVYGKNVSVACIGPCGEMKMGASSIAVTDIDGNPCRHAARGGLGAVMGSKGLKAIVIKDHLSGHREPLNREGFKKAVKEVADWIKNHPRVPLIHNYGTAGIINLDNERGSLVTRNFRSGSFENSLKINGETMVDLMKKRGGKMGHTCMRGCAVRCSPVFHGENGEHITSALEYETLALLGSNLGIDDIDGIALADRKCDDYGLDTMEMGATIGVLTEDGVNLMKFGDSKKLLELLDEVGKGSYLGKILGQGVTVTSRVFGIDRVPAVKGQGIGGHAARSMKGLAVTYATSPQGADHTAGFVAEDCLSPIGQVARSRNSQINMAIVDSLGFCYFAFMAGQLDISAKLLNALYGLDLEGKDLLDIGKSVLREERSFNVGAGFNEADDRLPEFMKEEPLPPHNVVFDIPDEEVDSLFKGL